MTRDDPRPATPLATRPSERLVVPAAPAASALAAPTASLALANGRRLPLVEPEVRIGRAPTNDIVLDDRSIADRHALLQRVPGGWLLTSLGRPGSTAVNDEPVERPVVVFPGDRVRFGRLECIYHEASAASADGAALAWPAGAGAPPAVALSEVVKTYPTAGEPLPVLRGVSLTVAPGEFIAVVGPSGCGKSTLLNVVTGIDRPDSGRVVVGGQDIGRLGAHALVGWRGRNVGIVFQFFQLLPTLTAAENVMLPMAFCRTYRGRERHERALDLLRLVGVGYAADRLPSVLSGGEQQRVAIARALANDPPLLVADEPTGNLDERTGRQVFELFARLVEAGKTVLMVTHDPTLARGASRCIEMRDGRIVGSSASEQEEA